ncbi:murein hydrolase activator EnvC family protein [Catellatospora sichuanensis]|uniref:murein hydrolase activator EnvC family protein n=1 Tax=Catellatospora sichuanensis TaxID=1969805 RepID=UPI0011831A62|nr:M23 family metallopeptidase [Catellatospora sichuanensis]
MAALLLIIGVIPPAPAVKAMAAGAASSASIPQAGAAGGAKSPAGDVSLESRIRMVAPTRARPQPNRLTAELRAPNGWRWPLTGTPHLVRRFDPPPQPWLPGHRGVDLAAAAGSPVLAASAGTVVYAGMLAGRGVVSVDHPGGLRTTYEPVEPLVEAGDSVATGTPLGTLAAGHAGCPTAACLHWGLRRGGVYLDPLAVLGLGRVRLLPGGTHSPVAIPFSRAAGPAAPRRAARSRRRCCRSGR